MLIGGTFPHCDRAFKAAAPAEMPPGSPFGTNLRALVLHLRFSQNICRASSSMSATDSQFGR
jgi:transposase